jgi:Mannose-6-phosphate isomerase
MVIKNSEHVYEQKPAPFGGTGTVTFKRLINTPDELYNKGRVFSIATLEKGGEFGIHQHDKEEEFYCILSGKGDYYDNGTIVPVEAGDTTVCRSGESHGIKNTGDEDLVYLALILFE